MSSVLFDLFLRKVQILLLFAMSLVCLSDYEARASTIIAKPAWDYYRSGAGHETTLNLNRGYFQRIRLLPKCLCDVSKLNTSTSVLGFYMKMPVGISPTAMQRMAHPDGECANARAAEKAGVIFTLSTIATSSIEEVAKAAPNCIKWFQLYIYKDRTESEKLIRRAERAGFKAIVLTVDTPGFGQRYANMRNQFTLAPHLKMANFEGANSGGVTGGKDSASGINQYVSDRFDRSLTWTDVKWLVNFTKLPVIVKGVLRPDDAIKAIECGCKGILVSNHGARQVDTVPATIEILPTIVEAVSGRIPVMLDGGVFLGTDVLKAIAYGASMVFIGRPALWGLAVDGQKGVEDVLHLLKSELEISMSICGTPTIEDITRDLVTHEANLASKL